MPKNISFSMTTSQVKNQSKTVTRRQGWKSLKAGTLLQPIIKGMGLKKGEKVKKIGGLIKVVSVTSVQICEISKKDVINEGFPNFEPRQFIEMYCKANKVKPLDYCNRIVFEYI